MSRLEEQLQVLGSFEALQPSRAMPTEEIDLSEWGRLLWRRKWVILGTVVALTLLALLIILELTPRYTAGTLVMIDARKEQVVDVEAVLTGLSADQSTIESEIEVIRSRGLAAKVVEELQLDRNPEFNVNLRAPSMLGSLLALPGRLAAGWLTSENDQSPQALADMKRRIASERERIVDAFLKNLTVEPRGRSHVLALNFESEQPRIAALVANTLADFYIVAQLEAKFSATQRATQWLNDRVEDLRGKVVATEQAVEEFRQESGLIRGTDATLATQEISELNSRLLVERTRQTEAEARLRQIEQLIGSGGAVETASDVLQSPLIQSLREQEALVERKAAELSVKFGESHIRRVSVRAELGDLREKIKKEVGRIIQGYRNEVVVAKARVNSLIQALFNLKQNVGTLDTAEIRLRALEREATANRTIYEKYLARAKETSHQEEIQQPDAVIISLAAVPEQASFPRKGLILGLTLFGSLVLGIVLSFILEKLDHGFRSVDQIERLTGLTPLGLVPQLPKSAANPANHNLDKPASAYAEAIRTLYTRLLLLEAEQVPKVMMVSSSVLGESKTTTAVSLANLQASVGKRVIVVDCDIRRPAAHRAFDANPGPGLVEYLSGTVSLEDAIQRHARSDAQIMPAGSPAPNPPELLGSAAMKDLMKELAKRYDLVILDSAPVAAVSDAQILARQVDKVLFLVNWAKTRRETVMRSLRQLIDAGGDVAGVLLTQVDVRKHAQYGYSDSGSYYGKVSEYYVE